MSSKFLLNTVCEVFDIHQVDKRQRFESKDGTYTLFIGPTSGILILRSERFNLSIGDTESSEKTGWLFISMGGEPTEQDYKKLAELDNMLSGRLCKWLLAHEYPDYANTIEKSGFALYSV